MKKIKLLTIILFALLMTGCTVDYTLEFSDGKVIESASIVQLNDLYGVSDLSKELDDIIEFNKDETNAHSFYNMEKVIGPSLSGIKLSYEYSANYFVTQSVFIRSCYDDASLEITSDRLILSTSKVFKCFDYLDDSFNVKITLDYNVASNNADLVDGNTYTWYIDELDSDNSIYIEFSQYEIEEEDSFVDNIKKTINEEVVISFGTIAIAVLVGVSFSYLIIKNRNNKNNRI